MTLQDKVDLLEAKAGEVLFERSNEIKCIINALLSRKHIVLLGPPGVAKSMLTRTMVNLIDGIEDGEYFEWALTKFTEPSEVVGPHSITQMTQDRYIRTTRRKLPEAKICFLDETFCGSSALLNVLLPILNERIFYNNDEPTK
ncbi:MAG: AAA family ATPase, partial [Saprospiraceae bacterium]